MDVRVPWRSVAVLGGGESGTSAALLAKKKGLRVFLSESGQLKEPFRKELTKGKVEFEEGSHDADRLFRAEVWVKSPGIPNEVPLVREGLRRGIPVISEIEFAARFTNAFLIGITGTNGKTTTSMLTNHLLVQGGLRSGLGGNVGKAFARWLLEPELPHYVLEISSFQLDNSMGFRPDIAMLLNISPDHLDRYGGVIDRYIAAKFRITEYQRSTDLFLYHAEDRSIKDNLDLIKGNARRRALFLGNIHKRRLKAGGHEFDLTHTQLPGLHNAMNALFAVEAALETGVHPERIQAGLDSFRPAPHRMEVVGTINGVPYINDSKATNVESVWYALDAIKGPLVWIAGGQDKGNDYRSLVPLVKEKVHSMICLGVDNRKLLETFRGLVEVHKEVRSTREAVEVARSFAKKGDTVLLSPACASFDLFNNFEDRGDQFRQLVQEFAKK